LVEYPRTPQGKLKLKQISHNIKLPPTSLFPQRSPMPKTNKEFDFQTEKYKMSKPPLIPKSKEIFQSQLASQIEANIGSTEKVKKDKSPTDLSDNQMLQLLSRID